jgi:D-amino-acid dehydrogenase
MVQAATFDAVVVCAAIGSGALLAPLGVRLPLLPVWGYSLTAPLRRVDGMPLFGPRAAVMDERFKVAISRLGRRVRVAGSAEIGGRAETFDAAAVDTLHRVLQDWYPGCANLRRVQRWKGARPMLPDGPPVIGASPAPGVWLNVGHGSSGWALACGSARLVADALAHRPPSVPIDGLGFERIAAA